MLEHMVHILTGLIGSSDVTSPHAAGYTSMRLFFFSTLLVMSHVILSSESQPMILNADFDTELKQGLHKALLKHPAISLAQEQGINGSNAIKVAYIGCEKGSERVVVRYPLGKQLQAAQLQFHVRFDQDFQFVAGGKLHGLGPKKPITGGKARQADGWSARCMFKKDGRIATYIYDQAKEHKWGIGIQSKNPVFKKDTWHQVTYHIYLNDVNQQNGRMRVLIDGEVILDHQNLNIRGLDDERTLIQTFLFSTFHGGNQPKWAPKDKNGDYKTVYAYFDNFQVHSLE